ncbi:hypothetical protein T4A_3520 [Trichinella pseudospiralis]|uniref:Uncharacterized protein n=1 Tax=Trichinella pseudospiralis TaxID=6337 RepID=A0A0V1EAF8_TRIPS|nr:hypothetical protein T4A_3520 [Trichinella pseudospiralis]
MENRAAVVNNFHLGWRMHDLRGVEILNEKRHCKLLNGLCSDLEVLQASSAFIGAVLGDKCPIKPGRTRRQCKRAFFKNA